jgi:hypothetical protein
MVVIATADSGSTHYHPQQGEPVMTGKAITWAILAVALFLIIGVFSSGVGINNTAVDHEASVKAQYEQNKNNYDNYFKKLLEVSQVSEMYRDDLKDVYDGAMQGRYGKDGSKAVFQWIQEKNPDFDASLYHKIQDIIEAGRNSFEADQKSLIDRKRAYFDVFLKRFPDNVTAGFLGFPKIDEVDYKIVTSNETEDAFESGKSDPIDIRRGQD